MRRSHARWRNHDGRFVAGGRIPEVGVCAHEGCGRLTMPEYEADASGFIDPFKVAESRRFCREHRQPCKTCGGTGTVPHSCDNEWCHRSTGPCPTCAADTASGDQS